MLNTFKNILLNNSGFYEDCLKVFVYFESVLKVLLKDLKESCKLLTHIGGFPRIWGKTANPLLLIRLRVGIERFSLKNKGSITNLKVFAYFKSVLKVSLKGF